MYCVVLEAATLSNINLWLGGEVMLELKSVKVVHFLMTTRQALRQLHCLSAPGIWNLNTGTRPTESESFRSARMARNRARYAQRTERQRLHDAHQRRMPGGASPAAGEYGSLSVINSAAQRLENKALLIERSSVPAMLYYLLMFSTSRTSLLSIALCVRFVVLRDAETRRAWQ